MLIATWNLQRRSLSGADMEAQIRKDILQDLIKAADIVFLQEVPQDLYQAARANTISVLDGTLRHKGNGYRLYANPKVDGQAEDQGCKSVIVAAGGYQVLPDNFMSGGEGFRLPVSIIDGTDIFTSGHFTSSDSAAENLRSYINKGPPIPNGLANWRWVIGADFNFSAAGNNRGAFVRISQPDEATHESGSILDGFYCESHGNAQNYQFRQTRLWQAPGRTTELRTERGSDGEKGYCCIVDNDVTASGRSSVKRRNTCYKISDHSPVVTECD